MNELSVPLPDHRKFGVKGFLQTLIQAFECRGTNCRIPDCVHLLIDEQQFKTCTKEFYEGCSRCKKTRTALYPKNTKNTNRTPPCWVSFVDFLTDPTLQQHDKEENFKTLTPASVSQVSEQGETAGLVPKNRTDTGFQNPSSSQIEKSTTEISQSLSTNIDNNQCSLEEFDRQDLILQRTLQKMRIMKENIEVLELISLEEKTPRKSTSMLQELYSAAISQQKCTNMPTRIKKATNPHRKILEHLEKILYHPDYSPKQYKNLQTVFCDLELTDSDIEEIKELQQWQRELMENLLRRHEDERSE